MERIKLKYKRVILEATDNIILLPNDCHRIECLTLLDSDNPGFILVLFASSVMPEDLINSMGMPIYYIYPLNRHIGGHLMDQEIKVYPLPDKKYLYEVTYLTWDENKKRDI